MLIFRQLFDPQSGTYTYLLAERESAQAVLIDPVFEQVRRDLALLGELGLRLTHTLDSHVHADHVTSAWLLKQKTGSQICISAASGATGADRYLAPGERVAFGGRHLETWTTPGHTAGCVTHVLDDRAMAFTGDCLLIRSCGRTDFQQGDARQLYRSVHDRIFSLPAACLLYPGHDYRGSTVTSVGEEQRFNPRLGGQIAEDDFVGYMSNLHLPHPKKIYEAVPANLTCGRPAADQAGLAEPGWAPLMLTFAGVWEVAPEWLEENRAAAQILDVREPAEFTGPLGHIRGARVIPLGQLTQRLDELARNRPVVAVCRAGGRSARATAILQEAGFKDVANLAGGMLRWRAQGFEVDGAQQ